MDEQMGEDIQRIAKWVYLQYGLDGVKEMATSEGFVKYIDLYNEDMIAFKDRLLANKPALRELASDVFKAVRARPR